MGVDMQEECKCAQVLKLKKHLEEEKHARKCAIATVKELKKQIDSQMSIIANLETIIIQRKHL